MTISDGADSMASVLELMGQEVQTAYSGAEAITAAASFQPAVILMDIGMPGLNGTKPHGRFVRRRRDNASSDRVYRLGSRARPYALARSRL